MTARQYDNDETNNGSIDDDSTKMRATDTKLMLAAG